MRPQILEEKKCKNDVSLIGEMREETGYDKFSI